MQIFIMRHGEASALAGDDFSRTLNVNGIQEAKVIGQWLVQNSPKTLDIIVSPYIRTQQTCEHVASALLKSDLLIKQLKSLDLITPSGEVQQAHDFLDGYLSQYNEIDHNSHPAILFISHMPFVSYFVAELTEERNTPIFSTGAIAVIDYDTAQMKGELVDIISPCQLSN